MHSVQLIRTNMGRYMSVCTCGWQSKITAKNRAIASGEKHKQKHDAPK